MKRALSVLLVIILVLSAVSLMACQKGSSARTTITREEWDAFVNADNLTIQTVGFSSGEKMRATTKFSNGFYCYCMEAMNEEEALEWENDKILVYEQIVSRINENNTDSNFEDLTVDDFLNDKVFEDVFISYTGAIVPLSECTLVPSHKDSQGNLFGTTYTYENSENGEYISFVNAYDYCYVRYLDKCYRKLVLYSEEIKSVTKWVEDDDYALTFPESPDFSEMAYDEKEKAYVYYGIVSESQVKLYLYFENGVPTKSVIFAADEDEDSISDYTPENVKDCSCQYSYAYYSNYGSTTVNHTFSASDIVERID